MILFMGIYPLLVLAIARMAPAKGEGETVSVKGRTVGYQREGRLFSMDKYFQGRPSAAGYHAESSAGSNKGPSNPEYLRTVRDRIDTFLAHNPGIHREEIPSDLVTASGSGLDPDISLQAALVQVPRIARVRRLPQAKLEQLVRSHAERSVFNGIEKINVLQLNIQLDEWL
jgi:K+-transporting ATPase ATPase C chain